MTLYRPGWDGGWKDLPPDLESALVNSRRKIRIWSKACELAEKNIVLSGKYAPPGDPFHLLTKAYEIVFFESGQIWDPPQSFGLESSWGSNQYEADAIVNEHRVFLSETEQNQRKILRDMAKYRELDIRQSRIERARLSADSPVRSKRTNRRKKLKNLKRECKRTNRIWSRSSAHRTLRRAE